MVLRLFPEPWVQPLCPGLADGLGSSRDFLGALVQASALQEIPPGCPSRWVMCFV